MQGSLRRQSRDLAAPLRRPNAPSTLTSSGTDSVSEFEWNRMSHIDRNEIRYKITCSGPLATPFYQPEGVANRERYKICNMMTKNARQCSSSDMSDYRYHWLKSRAVLDLFACKGIV